MGLDIYFKKRKKFADSKAYDSIVYFQEKWNSAFYDLSDDVYDLIPEWNKEMIPEIIRRIKDGNWKCSTSENDITNLQNYYEGKHITCELRWLGIVMACYDEDNFALEYPIKITTKEMEYENVRPSESDPNQGWESYDDDEEEDW